MGRRRKLLKDPIDHVVDWQRRSRFPDEALMLMKVNFSPSYVNEVEDILIGAIDAKYKMARQLSGFIDDTKKKGLTNYDIAPVLGVSHDTIRDLSSEKGAKPSIFILRGESNEDL